MAATVATLLLLAQLAAVTGILPECEFLVELKKRENECAERVGHEINASVARGLYLPGCPGMWDNLSCWPAAAHGDVRSVPCPDFIALFKKRGVVYRNCTHTGWTDPYPKYDEACGLDDVNENETDERSYYRTVKITYTVGYSTSLIALTAAMLILCLFRKLHCTRNYIHMHLFMSFILRAISVFIKDAVLFPDNEGSRCSTAADEDEYFDDMENMKLGCQLTMVFFQYCIMANYSWLLVEGLYLHTLLLISFFSERKYFCCYILIGWGAPAIFIVPWALSRWIYENTGCWDTNDNHEIWWIIKGPILFCILVNFILFISIIRILIKKLKSPDVGGTDSSHYKRLVKSTLLLIPLFGVHYIVFAFTPDNMLRDFPIEMRLYFELSFGSFQGFAVAILYCFLNGEVQAELKRKWRRWCVDRYLSVDLRQQHNSTVSNGNNGATQLSLLTKCSPKTRSSSLQTVTAAPEQHGAMISDCRV
ncbi:vasoactive intestinal polypeptide receptor-like [Petromyzon marinus]|uniref:Vasoactive intestinal polypeptide receptor-like n=1 Tax=Petromyzon marinus TaxID=7757 RepID=A0AAJ7TRF1_PETMA|nr:vasoactive intestinal polypeptide receptor-like [Petromyzon marinus]